MFAFTNDEYDMVKFLIYNGANVNAICRTRNTALDVAVINSSIKRILCIYRKNNIKKSEYKYFYDKLKTKYKNQNNSRVIELLLENGAKFSSNDFLDKNYEIIIKYAINKQ